jgi:hypothetical protein
MDDYDLWKRWWYAVLYGAGRERRMQLADRARAERDSAEDHKDREALQSKPKH